MHGTGTGMGTRMGTGPWRCTASPRHSPLPAVPPLRGWGTPVQPCTRVCKQDGSTVGWEGGLYNPVIRAGLP